MCLNPILEFQDDLYNRLRPFDTKLKKYTNLDKINENCLNLINNYLLTNKINRFPCKKCLECISYNKIDWLKRCELERKNWSNCYFLTFTFDNDNYHLHNENRFLSRWIDENLRNDFGKNAFKYFAVSEYGSITNRFHFHMILFTNINFVLDELHLSKRNNMLYINDYFSEKWTYGFHTINLATSVASFRYCVKYTAKNQNLKIYCSRGLGNVISNFDTIKYNDVPKSLLQNAYMRNWNARKQFALKKIDKEQLNIVVKSNEKYFLLKQKLSNYFFAKNWNTHFISPKILRDRYNTKNLHIVNSKKEL